MNEERAASLKKENGNLPKIICGVLTGVTLATIILGFYFKNPFYIIVGILPAAVYEAIRTEGFFTKAGAIIITLLAILEILAIKGIIYFDLAAWSGQSSFYFSGYSLPLGNIIFIFPAVSALLSLVLLLRTYGVYTKWLSVLLLLSSVTLLYLVNKETLFELLKTQHYYYY